VKERAHWSKDETCVSERAFWLLLDVMGAPRFVIIGFRFIKLKKERR